MSQPGFHIALYDCTQLPDVTGLLRSGLWRQSGQDASYFKWKYHDNPYVSEPLGVVAAADDGRIVGFRGYLALRWRVGDGADSITVLVPGDTVVDSAYRRKGLSVAMGEWAAERFEGKAQIFLNMTAGKNSVPGYLRLGFYPLEEKSYLTNASLAEELRSRPLFGRGPAFADSQPTFGECGIQFGRFGDVMVSPRPLPEEMSGLAAVSAAGRRRITLVQDDAFFRWRYANPAARYAFYCALRGNNVSGYLALKILSEGRALIVDYAARDRDSVVQILSHIAETPGIKTMRVLGCGVDDDMRTTLEKTGFSDGPLRRLLTRVRSGTAPILVRPVRRDCAEKDWRIAGLDIRREANWRIKPICSDAV